MAGIATLGWNQVDMAGKPIHGWKQLEMSGNNWKLLQWWEIALNDWKLKEMTVLGRKNLNIAGNVQKGLEIAGNG